MNYFPLIPAAIILTCGLIATAIAVPVALDDRNDTSDGGWHGYLPLEVEVIENYGPSSVVHPPGQIQLQSYVENGDGELVYVWQAEDGTTLSSDPNLIFEVSENLPGGYFTITLGVTDEDGDTGSDSFTFEIGAPAWMINTISVDIGNEFPDRESSSGSIETHTPVLLFAYPRIDGPPPVEVSFTATIGWISIYSFHWDFGDGSETRTGSSTSHLYETSGNFTVTISNGTHDDPDNMTVLATIDIVILDEEPDDGISIDMDLPYIPEGGDGQVLMLQVVANPPQGTAPLYVNFNTNMAPEVTSGFLWNFGDDGPLSFNRAASHIFIDPGTYHVTVTYTNGLGFFGYGEIDIIVGSPSYELAVEIEVIPTEYTNSFRLIAHPNLEVSLTYDWTFTNEPQESGMDILHHFLDYGMNYAEVHAYNDELGLFATARVEIFISNFAAPSVHFLIHPAINDPSYFQFEPIVSGGVPFYTFTWSFGDGSGSSDQYPVHYYYDEGYYKVELYVEDSEGNIGYYSEYVFARSFVGVEI